MSLLDWHYFFCLQTKWGKTKPRWKTDTVLSRGLTKFTEQSRAVCRVSSFPSDYCPSQTYGSCDAACGVAAWECWQLSKAGYPLNVLSVELHEEYDAQLFDSRFKGVSAYLRSRLGNSHGTSEKQDSKKLQERRLAILILLTNFLKYLTGKIFFPCSMFQKSSLV